VRETDVATLLGGISVIVNRITDKAAKRLHWKLK
jgi:hypothetical protein